MYWASRRPTAWIRSVVPIVWRTHGEVAAQSPARGWAPPTTTTDRAPGRRSSGRCFSGAWASNAVASAMPQTVAPDLRATDLSVAVALGARSDITGAGSVSPGRPRVAGERCGPASFVAGSVSSGRPRVAGEGRGPASFELPVFAPDGADAHALEALGDRVAEEADGLKALREEVAVNHRPAPVRIVLVHDLEQPLLQGADAIGLRARVAALAVVRRFLDAPIAYFPGQARGAHAQTRRRPDALVHGGAARVRARGLGERRVGLERQRRDQRRVVEQAVLGVQDDVRRERARAEPRELGGVHHRHRWLVTVDGQGWRLDRVVGQRALDEVAHRMDRHVLAEIVAGDLHHPMIRTAPRARARPVAARDDDAPGPRQDVLRAIAFRHLLAERLDRRDPDHARAGLEADSFHLLLTRHDGPRIIPSGIIRPA